MLKRIYRQRRRLGLAIIAVTLVVVLGFVGNGAFRFELKHTFNDSLGLFAISIVLAVLIVACGFSLLIILCAPSLRRAVEASAVAAVGSEAVMLADVYLPVWATDGIAGWIWFIAFFYGVLIVLEKEFLVRFGLRLPLAATRTRTINASPEAIWAAVAPDAELIGTYWTGSIAQVDPRPDIGPDTVNVRYHMGPPLSFVQTQTRRIWERPLHLLYDFYPEAMAEGAPGPGVRGSFEMCCVPLPDGRTEVSLTHRYPGLGIGTWSLIWLDDIVGSELDAIEAHLTGRKDWSIAGWAARKMAAA